MEEIKNKKVLFVIGAIFLLILVIGGTFAYFQIVANNNATTSTISGAGDLVGMATLVTNTEELNIKLTAEDMKKEKANTIYSATKDGKPVVTEGIGLTNQTLATASMTESDIVFDCTYTYDISATVTKEITDGSDEDIVIFISNDSGEMTFYYLKQLLEGVVYTGKLQKLKYGEDQMINIEVLVHNSGFPQNDLSGNEFIITIDPKEGEEGFSCSEHTPYDLAKESKGQAVSSFMVANQSKIDGLWSSGLEGDGLRYVGSGAYNGDTTPSNFICFGTTSMDECKANENKYMYRIIGVFPDEQGNQHLKLKKFKQLGVNVWHSTNEDKNWGESTLYTVLNGSYYLGNTTYDYLQNATWSDKIVEWKWTAVNTKTKSDNGPDYYSGTTMTPANIYLHEMNRSTKTSTVGEWTYPEGKIGLMYVSDYALSLGDEALAITGSTSINSAKLKTGWLHYTNNGNSSYEWTIARYEARSSTFSAWYVDGGGNVYYYSVTRSYGVAPVFYLTSNTTISGGMGTYSEPYIIG